MQLLSSSTNSRLGIFTLVESSALICLNTRPLFYCLCQYRALSTRRRVIMFSLPVTSARPGLLRRNIICKKKSWGICTSRFETRKSAGRFAGSQRHRIKAVLNRNEVLWTRNNLRKRTYWQTNDICRLFHWGDVRSNRLVTGPGADMSRWTPKSTP